MFVQCVVVAANFRYAVPALTETSWPAMPEFGLPKLQVAVPRRRNNQSPATQLLADPEKQCPEVAVPHNHIYAAVQYLDRQ